MRREAPQEVPKTKKNKKILRRMQIKLWWCFSIICLLFVFLIGRLMYIQQTSGAKYEKIVLSQQSYDSTIIPYQRGNITDCRGTVLATSIDVYNVILDCKVLNANATGKDKEGHELDNVNSTITLLTNCFPQIDATDAKRRVIEHPTSAYQILAKKVSYEDMQIFKELAASDTFKGRVYGVWFEKQYKREYPYGTLAAATLGYASSGNVGVIGLENQYSSVLNGINGRSYGYQNEDSNLEQTTIEPQNGNNIVLTIDANIQSIVEKAMADFNKDYEGENSYGSKHTACVVMDPTSGDILAMGQYPSFDLNDPRNTDRLHLDPEVAEFMTEEDIMDELNKLWQNYCVTYTYEPGSTFKPFTVAAGLEYGSLLGDESFYCDGSEHISDFEIHCVNRRGHGMQDIQQALSNSCNDCLMQMSYKIGAHNFAETQRIFGFGQKTGVDLPGETSTANLIYDEKGLNSLVNLATNSFGQNFNTTMVQMATAWCALINGGDMYQPHLVSRITDTNGNTVKEIEPVVMKKCVSEEVSNRMREYLFQVVDTGTAKTAKVDFYTMGGKTGTAEKQPRGRGNYLVSFIGFAPYDDPKLLVYVIVDEPNTPDQAHSTFAQSIAHNVFEQVLPYMNVKRTDDVEEDNSTILDFEEITDPTYPAIPGEITTIDADEQLVLNGVNPLMEGITQ